MSRYPTIDQPTTPLDGNGLPYQRLDTPLAAFAQPAAGVAQAADLLALGAKQYREQLLAHQLLAHESAANDALNQYRIEANDSWRRFGGSKLRDAVDGHDGYQQSLQTSRQRALTGLSAAALGLLRPHLDREHLDRTRLGEAHRNLQDRAWADHSSLASLVTDTEEAVLHRGDPQRVMQLALRGDGEWLKLGERRGWSDQQIADQARASRGRLYGAVIDQQLHEGDIAGATTLLAGVQHQLDPATNTQLGARIQLAQARLDAQSDVPPSTAGEGFGPVPGTSPTQGGGDVATNVSGAGVGVDRPNNLAGVQFAQVQMPSRTTDIPTLPSAQTHSRSQTKLDRDEVGPSEGQLVLPSAEAEPKSLMSTSDAEPSSTSDDLGPSLFDINGQKLPQGAVKKPTRFSSVDKPRYERLISYITNAYGKAYAAQMQQSLWVTDGAFDKGRVSFADQVVNRLFQNMAGSDKEITQEDVDRAVDQAMDNRKAIVNSALLSVFVPKDIDEKKITDGLFALRFRYFDDSRGSRIFSSDADDRGSFWILQKIPGQRDPALKEIQYDGDTEWAARWVNIDPNRFALVLPGQGFLADKDGHVYTVTLKDVVDAKLPSWFSRLDRGWGEYYRPFKDKAPAGYSDKTPFRYSNQLLIDKLKRQLGWIDVE